MNSPTRIRIGIVVFAAALTSCAPAGAPSRELRFAIASPSAAPVMGVGEARVLTSRVNLREPIRMGAESGEVTVTVAVRGRRGLTFALEPETLAARGVTPYDYEGHEGSGLQLESASRVKLHDGRTLGCWTDDATRRVMARVFDGSGVASGPAIIVSGSDAGVMGAPQAATVDGHHVVVAYFTTTETGFALVATPMKVP
jgi:hypothetical protein